MDNSLLQTVKRLHDAIKIDPVVKEYNVLAKEVKNNPLFQKMEQELKDLQQAMVLALNNSDSTHYQKVLQQYQSLKQQYDEHPLLHNYRVVKEEVNTLLQQINQIINEFEASL